MKKIIVAAFLAVALLFTGACGGSNDNPPHSQVTVTAQATPTEQPQDLSTVWLQTVKERAPQLNQINDSTLLSTGRQVCNDLQGSPNFSKQDLVDYIVGFSKGTKGLLNPSESAYFVGASARAFCPPVADRIVELGSNGGDTVTG